MSGKSTQKYTEEFKKTIVNLWTKVNKVDKKNQKKLNSA